MITKLIEQSLFCFPRNVNPSGSVQKSEEWKSYYFGGLVLVIAFFFLSG